MISYPYPKGQLKTVYAYFLSILLFMASLGACNEYALK